MNTMLPNSRPSSLPTVECPSLRTSNINSLIPYTSIDPSAVIQSTLNELLEIVNASNVPEHLHVKVNRSVQDLLEYRFILAPELLRWTLETLLWCIFQSDYRLEIRAHYATTLPRLLKVLKKAKVMVVQYEVKHVISFLKQEFFSMTSRPLRRYEEECFRTILRAVRKCRLLTTSESSSHPCEPFESIDLQDLDKFIVSSSLVALLCPYKTIPLHLSSTGVGWEYRIKHVVQANMEVIRVASKHQALVCYDDVFTVLDACLGYFGIKGHDHQYGKTVKLSHFKGIYDQHIKLVCDTFESIATQLGYCIGKWFGIDDAVDSLILQFFRQFELVVYPRSGNRNFAENLLKAMQTAASVMAKDVNVKRCTKERYKPLCMLISQMVLRMMYDRNISSVLSCQAITRSITSIFPDLIINSLFGNFDSIDTLSGDEPHRVPSLLAMLSSVIRPVLCGNQDLELSLNLFTLLAKIIETIDPNDHFKTIGVSSVLENIALFTSPCDEGKESLGFGACETDIMMEIWMKIRFYLERLISDGRHELGGQEYTVVEYLVGSAGRLFGLCSKPTLNALLGKIVEFVSSVNGYVVRKPFSQLLTTISRLSGPEHVLSVWSLLLPVLHESLNNADLMRYSRDRASDHVIWYISVISSCFRTHHHPDCSLHIISLWQTTKHTNNSALAKAVAKLTKAYLISIGTVQIHRIGSSNEPCRVSHISPRWDTPSMEHLQQVSSLVPLVLEHMFSNVECRSVALLCLLKGVLHVKSCSQLLLSPSKTFDTLVERLVDLIFDALNCPANSTDGKNAAAKVGDCLFACFPFSQRSHSLCSLPFSTMGSIQGNTPLASPASNSLVS